MAVLHFDSRRGQDVEKLFSTPKANSVPQARLDEGLDECLTQERSLLDRSFSVNTQVERASLTEMSEKFQELCRDLAAETAALVGHLNGLSPAQWELPTDCEPWTIKDHVSHLAWNDEAVVRAITDPESFRQTRPTTPMGIQSMVDSVITDNRERSGSDVLRWFTTARGNMLEIMRDTDPRSRMAWYGPDMSVMSKVTARFMETWAHGFDVVGALKHTVTPTDRVRHVVFLGLQAIPNAFIARGKSVPDQPIRADLMSPSGERWQFGDPDAKNVVSGSAYDLALVVTQRLHVDDADLEATGRAAQEWLRIAQAFAGPPGRGRAASGPSSGERSEPEGRDASSTGPSSGELL